MSGKIVLVLPDEPVPVRLMNTIWAGRDGLHDCIETREDLRDWLTAVLPGSFRTISSAEMDRFRGLRDALRRLAAHLTADERPTASSPLLDLEQAIFTVNRAVTGAATWPQLAARDGTLERLQEGTGTPAMRALSAIGSAAIDLFTADDAPALKACVAPRCVLYFVRDHPRREWCSDGCGNRARVARHYARNRQRHGS